MSLCRCRGFVEAWASGYLIEFADGAVERHVARISDERTAELTARGIHDIGAFVIPSDRAVTLGSSFVAPLASLDASERHVSEDLAARIAEARKIRMANERGG